jgi:hypothetical protein
MEAFSILSRYMRTSSEGAHGLLQTAKLVNVKRTLNMLTHNILGFSSSWTVETPPFYLDDVAHLAWEACSPPECYSA